MMNATPVDWSPALALLAGSGSVTLLILLGLAWRWRGPAAVSVWPRSPRWPCF